MCNPKVDELSMMTYLSRFPHAKPKSGAPVHVKTNVARVRAYGPGEPPLNYLVKHEWPKNQRKRWFFGHSCFTR